MAWYLEKAQRACLIGKTRTGKSTLGTELVRRFINEYPNARILIIDSKPRYRAQYDLAGEPMRYSNWVAGDKLEQSVGIFDMVNLKSLFVLYPICIFHSMTNRGERVPAYEVKVSLLADQLFRLSGPKMPTLIYIDEFYDITHGNSVIVDKEILKTIRAGGEKNMAVLAGAQRPRSIPIPILSESDKYYIFKLKKGEDKKYLRDYGVLLNRQAIGHNFVYYDDSGEEVIEKMMRLTLAKGAA